MPFSVLNAEMLVTEPIEIEWREGHFHVVDKYSENFIVKRAIPPRVFFANMARTQRAIEAYEAEQRAECEFIRVFPQNTAAKLYGS